MENFKEIGKRTGKSEDDVKNFLNLVKRSIEPYTRKIEVFDENGVPRNYLVTRLGIGKIINKYGEFWQFDFEINDRWRKYSVLVKSDIDRETLMPYFKENSLLMRSDCGCETGQLFGDVTCDCKNQLDTAMKYISQNGEGMVIHLETQDGRGFGLPFKLGTLWLQSELKVNTVESAVMLSGSGNIDVRTYDGVIAILKYFNVATSCEIKLITNNPKKSEIFKRNGYFLKEYVPVVIAPTEYTLEHLVAKQEYLGHLNLVG